MNNLKELSEDYEDDEHNIDWRANIFNSKRNNKYIMIKRIGWGSYSSVWLCLKLENKISNSKMYAIKIHNTIDNVEGIREIEIYKRFRTLDIPFTMKFIDEIHINRIINEKKNSLLCCV